MEKLFKQLSDAHASILVLFHKTWVYHWNVVGEDFPQLHELFGGQYADLYAELDRLAEHMRYLNVKPLSSLNRVLEVSKVKEASSSVDAMGMVRDLLKSHEDICEMLTEVSEEAETQKSRGTTNLIDDLIEQHGKYVWMLRSITEKSSKQVKEEVEITEIKTEE